MQRPVLSEQQCRAHCLLPGAARGSLASPWPVMKTILIKKIEPRLQQLHERVLEMRHAFVRASPAQVASCRVVFPSPPEDVPGLGEMRAVQDELSAMETAFLGASLYCKFAGTEEQAWFRGFRKVFHATRAMAEALRHDILLRHYWCLLMGLQFDLEKNAAAKRALGPCLAETMALVCQELTDHQNVEAFVNFATKHTVAYARLSVMQRLVPDAASLSVSALRQRVAGIFELTMQRWVREHDFVFPRLWARFADLASGAEQLFLAVDLKSPPLLIETTSTTPTLIVKKVPKKCRRNKEAEERLKRWRALACLCCCSAS